MALAADLPGRVGEAEAADQDGAGAPQGVPHLATALSARDLAARRDDEGGDVLGGFAGHLGQHGGIGVGSQHDAGVPEHGLDDLQVGARGECEAGRAMPQIMQADRRQARGLGAIGSPFRPVSR